MKIKPQLLQNVSIKNHLLRPQVGLIVVIQTLPFYLQKSLSAIYWLSH